MAPMSDEQRKAMFASMGSGGGSGSPKKKKSWSLKSPKDDRSRKAVLTDKGIQAEHTTSDEGVWSDNKNEMDLKGYDDIHSKSKSIRGTITERKISDPNEQFFWETKNTEGEWRSAGIVHGKDRQEAQANLEKVYKGLIKDEAGNEYVRLAPDRMSEEDLAKLDKRLDKIIGRSKNRGSKEANEGHRHHKLMPNDLRAKIPALYSQDGSKDPIIYAKYFSPYGGYTYYATEFDGKDTFFGFGGFDDADDLAEYGYASLQEWAEASKGGVPLMERDIYFKPTKLSELEDSHNVTLAKFKSQKGYGNTGKRIESDYSPELKKEMKEYDNSKRAKTETKEMLSRSEFYDEKRVRTGAIHPEGIGGSLPTRETSWVQKASGDGWEVYNSLTKEFKYFKTHTEAQTYNDSIYDEYVKQFNKS